MKKWKIAFVFALVLLVALVGWQNRKAAQVLRNTEPSTLQENQLINIETASAEETDAVEGQSTTEEADCTDEHHVIRKYPDLDIVIDATCPAVTGARDIPYLAARYPGYYDSMLQEFLKQFPEAEEIEKNHWIAFGPDSEVLAYISTIETGYISFLNKKLDVNGGSEAYDHFSYDPLDEATLHYICSLPDDQLSPSDFAIKNAIQAVTPYTDFDLIPYNIGKETDSMTGKSWYRMKLQLSYQGTLISMPSQNGYVDADVGMADAGRLGLVSGRFSFSQIEEKGSCRVMSLDDILTIFEQQGYLSLLTANDFEGGSRYEIYRIQPEYFVEFRENPKEPLFRPVWSFYYKYYHPKDSTSWSYGEIKFYSDTGEVCYVW